MHLHIINKDASYKWLSYKEVFMRNKTIRRNIFRQLNRLPDKSKVMEIMKMKLKNSMLVVTV